MNINEKSYDWSFKPNNMSKKMFLETFCCLETQINQLVEHIKKVVTDRNKIYKPHIFYFGERGSGKTSLLLGLKYFIIDNLPAPRDEIIPIKFNEREEIDSLDNLALRIFDMLSNNTDSPHIFGINLTG